MGLDPIQSDSIPSHPVLSRPIPSHPIPSHPIPTTHVFSLLSQNVSSDDPRFSFATLWESFYTVFIVITGESWATMMALTIEQTSWVSAFYYLTLFILGNYIMINLFICILIDSLGHYQEKQRLESMLQKEKMRERGELPEPSFWKKSLANIASFRRSNSALNEKQYVLQMHRVALPLSPLPPLLTNGLPQHNLETGASELIEALVFQPISGPSGTHVATGRPCPAAPAVCPVVCHFGNYLQKRYLKYMHTRKLFFFQQNSPLWSNFFYVSYMYCPF